MPFNPTDIFKCDLHQFSTSDIKQWDVHMKEVAHVYDLHDKCSCGCGKPIHVSVDTKLDPSAKRIPRGQLHENCKSKIKDAPVIKEAGELVREKEKKEK